MTGTTHQLFALVSAFFFLIFFPTQAGPIVGTMAVVAVMVGALTPDLDHPTANLWRRILGGRAIGHIFDEFSGGHRHFTHSLIGIYLINRGFYWIINNLITPDYQANATIIWIAFMVGYISHPIADTLTDRGVPWLWPLQWHLRIPPGSKLFRITTGSIIERAIIRGVLVIATLLLLRQYGSLLLQFFT